MRGSCPGEFPDNFYLEVDCSSDDPGDEDYHGEENEQDSNSDDDQVSAIEPEGSAAAAKR